MELKFIIIVTKLSEEMKGREKKKCAIAQKNSYFPIPNAHRKRQILTYSLKV